MTTLLVIAKAPVPGRVKTRLCPPFTPEQAARLAEAALVDTLEAVLAAPADRRILVLDGAPGKWLPSGFTLVPQVSGTLDVRLAAAFASVEPESGPALLVGMDTPQLTPEHLTWDWSEPATAAGPTAAPWPAATRGQTAVAEQSAVAGQSASHAPDAARGPDGTRGPEAPQGADTARGSDAAHRPDAAREPDAVVGRARQGPGPITDQTGVVGPATVVEPASYGSGTTFGLGARGPGPVAGQTAALGPGSALAQTAVVEHTAATDPDAIPGAPAVVRPDAAAQSAATARQLALFGPNAAVRPDAVLGPAEDGGFWCIGFREPTVTLAAHAIVDVPMSRADTGAAQAARLTTLGLSTKWLVPLRDIDTAADAEAVARDHPDLRFAACLAELRSSYRSLTTRPTHVAPMLGVLE